MVNSIILASKSKVRKKILEKNGINCEVIPANIDEDSIKEKDPILCSQKIVLGKNLSARSLLDEEDKILPVLTSDTLVFAPDKTILGKPQDAAQNLEMLEIFSGKTHKVYSSVLVHLSGREIIKTSETSVTFTKMSSQEINDYVASEEGFGKAGGYGIHGPAAKFVEKIEGSYTNVVGLPLHETYEILKSLNLV